MSLHAGPNTDGRCREARPCIIYLAALAMRHVPNAGEQNSKGAFGILEEAVSPEAPDERKRFKEGMGTVSLRMMRKEASS